MKGKILKCSKYSFKKITFDFTSQLHQPFFLLCKYTGHADYRSKRELMGKGMPKVNA